MGCDVTLRSVLTNELHETICQKSVSETVDPIESMVRMYNDLQATGGYFRDPYNRAGLFPALGMDWARDVGPLVDEDTWELSVDGARHLLAELELRFVTPQAVDDAVSGQRPASMVEKILEQTFGSNDLDADPEQLMRHWQNKRETLIDLLRRSIALNEPLFISY